MRTNGLFNIFILHTHSAIFHLQFLVIIVDGIYVEQMRWKVGGEKN